MIFHFLTPKNASSTPTHHPSIETNITQHFSMCWIFRISWQSLYVRTCSKNNKFVCGCPRFLRVFSSIMVSGFICIIRWRIANRSILCFRRLECKVLIIQRKYDMYSRRNNITCLFSFVYVRSRRRRRSRSSRSLLKRWNRIVPFPSGSGWELATQSGKIFVV